MSQTFADLEVVVVDDGSSDNTAEIAESIRDKRLRYIWQPNSGPSAARNNGIVHSRGDCVAFLDADDLWLPHKLQQQLELLSRRPSVGLVYCGAHEVDQALRWLRTPELGPAWPPAGLDVFRRLLVRDHPPVAPLSTMLLRKDCFEEVGLFDEAIVQAEEWDLLFRLALRWDIAFLAEPLVLYRMGGHFNPEKRLGRRIGDAHLTTIHRACARLGDPSELQPLKVRALADTHWGVALYYYAVHQPNMAALELDQIAGLASDYLDFGANEHLGTSLAYVASGLYDTVTPLREALDFVDYAFDHFPCSVRRQHSDRRMTEAKLAAITAFDSFPRAELGRVSLSVTRALALDPRLFRNIGLLKLPLRAVRRGPAPRCLAPDGPCDDDQTPAQAETDKRQKGTRTKW